MTGHQAESNTYRDGPANVRDSSIDRSDWPRPLPTNAVRVLRSGPPERAAQDVIAIFDFELAGQRYGLPITQVREVLPLATLMPVPEAPAELLGCLRLRGALLPVLDLRRRLGLAPIAPELSQRIVVVEIGPAPLGLVVDAAGDVITLQALPSRATAEDPSRLVRCVVELPDRVVTLLNGEALVRTEVATFLGAVLGQDNPELASDVGVGYASETAT